MDTFSNRLKLFRGERKMTQDEIGAIVLNVSGRMVRYYEQGIKMPDINGVVLLADFFGVSIDYLLGRSNVREVQKGDG